MTKTRPTTTTPTTTTTTTPTPTTTTTTPANATDATDATTNAPADATIPPAALPTTPQQVAAAVDEEQRRQDAHLETIRSLVGASRALRLVQPAGGGGGGDDDGHARPGLFASLRRRLRGRRAERAEQAAQRAGASQGAQSVEDRLRGRIAGALQETRKASLLVDRFAALREALFADLERLQRTIDAARAGDADAAARVVAARVLVDGAGDGTVTDSVRDQARRQLQKAEQEVELAHRLAGRLEVVCAGARGLLDVIDTLSLDVASFARAAERELDVLSARARALSVAEDAQSVVDELERSLLSLSGSLDDVTVFASAVHERVSQTSSAAGLATALDTLVQGALARRAATAAREQAQSS